MSPQPTVTLLDEVYTARRRYYHFYAFVQIILIQIFPLHVKVTLKSFYDNVDRVFCPFNSI